MITKNYFAAANGYTGFRSYFDKVFDNKKFEHIFILKGGPGTGKSSIMKRISKKASEMSLCHDNIYCSSDPNSLDGVIVNSNHGRFAVIDGTAPHTEDAKMPGALDSIINLGENFDFKKLNENRNLIISLNNNKKSYYKNAYESLFAASKISARIKNILIADLCYKKAEIIAEEILKDKESNHMHGIMINNAFGKEGFTSKNCYDNYNKTLKVFGEYGEELIFMNVLREKVGQNYDYESFDPLDENYCDGIIIGDFSVSVTRSKENADIYAKELIDIKVDKEELNILNKARKDILNLAKRHFISASEQHFKLEEIYSASVDFEKNDILCEKIISKIF